MRISTIPQIYRHFNRWVEIFAVLSKYGLADWMSRFPLRFARSVVADRGGTAEAFANGRWIIDLQRDLHSMFELTLQEIVEGSELLIHVTSWTYWLSQFAVVGIALLWIYFRANERFLNRVFRIERRAEHSVTMPRQRGPV